VHLRGCAAATMSAATEEPFRSRAAHHNALAALQHELNVGRISTLRCIIRPFRQLAAAWPQSGRYRKSDRSMFVNAPNEWAEGTCLEPDWDFGRGWLEPVRSALGREHDRPEI